MGAIWTCISGVVSRRVHGAVRRVRHAASAVLRRLLRRTLPALEAEEELLEEPAGRRMLAEDPLQRLRRIRWRAQAAVRRGAEESVNRLLAHTRRASRRMPRGVDPLPANEWREDVSAWRDVGGTAWDDADAIETVHARAAILKHLHDRMSVGAARDIEPALALVDELIDLAVRRPVELVGLAMSAETSRADGGGCEHAYAVAALSTAIAARLGWDEQGVRDVALAGLFADAGMVLVAGKPGQKAGPLDDVEVNKLHRHPMYSVAMLASVRGEGDDHRGVTDAVLLGVLEHHEREDGTGYPRAMRDGAIHDVSRVLAVADCFCAALGDRPFRGPLSPHAALREVRDLAHAGRLWGEAAGALVSVTGLFPKGTTVVLSDGSAGVSLGIADPRKPDRPVVELRRRGVVLGVLDLAESDSRALSVAAALDAPAGEVRKAA